MKAIMHSDSALSDDDLPFCAPLSRKSQEHHDRRPMADIGIPEKTKYERTNMATATPLATGA